MEFRNAYERMEHKGLVVEGESLTQQHFKDECDINNIIRNYTKTGIFPIEEGVEPQYGDYSSVPEYLDAMNIIVRAKEQFEALPSDVRRKFDNDPAQMLEFVSKKENIKECVDLGLLNREALEIIKADASVAGDTVSPNDVLVDA